MKFIDPVNPAFATSTDQTRYRLTGVSIEGDMAVATNGRFLFQDEITRFVDIEPGNLEKFPDVTHVIPDPAKHTLRVGINVKLLANLAKCFGEDIVHLHLDPDGFKYRGYDAAAIVTGTKPTNSVGVFMTVRSDPHLEKNGMIQHLLALKAKRAAERAAAKTPTPATDEPGA